MIFEELCVLLIFYLSSDISTCQTFLPVQMMYGQVCT